MKTRQSDTHRTILQAPLCGAQTRQLAYEFVDRSDAAGRLKPVEGVDGDLVAIYADILGLTEEHLATVKRNEMVVVTSYGREIIINPRRVSR